MISYCNISKNISTEYGHVTAFEFLQRKALYKYVLLSKIFIFCRDQKDKIFSHSPKSQQLQQLKINHPTTATTAAPNVRQKSVVTLSSHSDSPAPYQKDPPEVKPVKRSTENKSVITSNTRNIAALAAQKKRRSRATTDGNNNHKISYLGDLQNKQTAENYLSSSRLATHDKKYPYGTDMTLRQLLGEEENTRGFGEGEVLKHGQGRYRKTMKKPLGSDNRSRHAVYQQENASQVNMTNWCVYKDFY